MKKLLLTLLVGLLAATGFAQDRKGFIGLGLGPSFATGDFANNFVGKGSGYAKTGLAIDMSAGYQTGRIFGLMALFKSQLNGYDTGAAFPGVEAETNGWLTRAFMAGPYVSVPMGQSGKLFFEVKALAGFGRTRSPEVSLIGISGTGSSKVVLKSEKANSFAAVAGAGFRFPVSERISLGLHADYFFTRPKFDYPTIPGSPVRQNISTLSTTVSFSYRFKNLLENRKAPGVFEKDTF